MSSLSLAEPGRIRTLRAEVAKIPAFVRRDFLVAWSYRMSFFSDIVGLVGQVLVFAFVGKMVDPSALPRYNGTEVTYLEFAAVGIALAVFIQFGLNRVSVAIRGEQLMGTLEAVLATPTAPSTVQFGAVAFDLLYIPLRTALFLAAVTIAFGLHMDPAGLPPAILLVLAFIPFVWGLGVLSAAALMTFRRGSGLIGSGVVVLGLLSGVYFPITLLPDWIEPLAQANPVALTIDGMRDALLGGTDWTGVGRTLAILVPCSALSLAAGLAAFRLSLRRERRLGTLGLY